MKTKSALSYFGSDAGVARELASVLDHCSHVTIPFCGGMSILPHLKARAVVANDLNEHALNFYRVASGVEGEPAREELDRCCASTLSHPSELTFAAEVLSSEKRWPPYVQAWAYWAQCWIGRKGKGGTKNAGGMPSVRWSADGGTNASRVQAAAEDLREWAEHFKRCEWTCLDFRELLPKVKDDPKCGIYCDPPWVGAGDDYLHSFTEQDHRDLASDLSRFEYTKVVIRYGDDPLIRELYQADEWNWTEASSRTQANTVRGEVWISN